jgi:hypothetical protein
MSDETRKKTEVNNCVLINAKIKLGSLRTGNTLSRTCGLKTVFLLVSSFRVSQQIFHKVCSIKFHNKLSSGNCPDMYRQTDRHDESKGHFFLLIMLMHPKDKIFTEGTRIHFH